MKISKAFIKNGILAVVFLIVCVAASVMVSNYFNRYEGNDKYNYHIYRSRIELAMEGTKDRIVSEIDSYIDSIAPDSGLNGIRLFDLCDRYCIDVRFAMAQAEVESHFGTKGIASKTNSVWNVKAYDGRSANDMRQKGDHFSHPDHSIEPYLILLTTSYIIEDKTEEDMFIKFVNTNGKRYASNTNYETMMLTVYNRINEGTNLKQLLKDYKKYKMILM